MKKFWQQFVRKCSPKYFETIIILRGCQKLIGEKLIAINCNQLIDFRLLAITIN